MLYKSTLEAKDGTPIPVFSNGKTMFSRYAPLKEVEAFGDNIVTTSSETFENKVSYKGFFLIGGLGSGLHIQSLMKRFPCCSILVVEKSQEEIDWLQNNFNLASLFAKKNLWLTTIDEVANSLLQVYNPLLHGDFSFLPLRSWMEQLPDEVLLLKSNIETTLKSIAGDYSTQAHFGKIWFRNFFLNLTNLSLPSPTPFLPNTQEYRKAIVAAAGPSLEKTIPDLKNPATRKSIYLIATDTALSILLKHHIIPDMTVTIDGQSSSLRHFCQKIPSSMVLAADISSCPGVIRRCKSFNCPVVFFRNNNPLPQLLEYYLKKENKTGLPIIDTGAGTVTAAAVDMAVALGFSSIQICGGDFAYIEGKPYSRGSYFEDQFCKEANYLRPLEHQYVELLYRQPTTKIGKKIVTPILQEYEKSLYQYMANHNHINFITDSTSFLSSDSNKNQPRNFYPCTLEPKKIQEFVSWYKDCLARKDEKIISSILPLYGWYIKKNNNKCDIFHIMKLAYSFVVRYTEPYGK